MSQHKGLTPEQRSTLQNSVREFLRSLDPEEKGAIVKQMIETGTFPPMASTALEDPAPMEHPFVEDEKDDGDAPSESEFE